MKGGMRSSDMAARAMNRIYLIIPTAIVAITGALRPLAARVLDGRDRNGRRRTLDSPVDGWQHISIDRDQAPVCVMCNCRVVDDVTHWRAIHHVPA